LKSLNVYSDIFGGVNSFSLIFLEYKRFRKKSFSHLGRSHHIKSS